MPDRIFVEQTSVSDLRKMAQNVDSDSDLRHCGMRCLCWLSHRKKKPFCSESQMVDRIALLNSGSCS